MHCCLAKQGTQTAEGLAENTTEGFVIEIVITVIISKVNLLITQTVNVDQKKKKLRPCQTNKQEPPSVSRNFIVWNYFLYQIIS